MNTKGIDGTDLTTIPVEDLTSREYLMLSILTRLTAAQNDREKIRKLIKDIFEECVHCGILAQRGLDQMMKEVNNEIRIMDTGK